MPWHRTAHASLLLRLFVAAGLVIDAVVHARLAANYQLAQPGGIGEGNLFRFEALLAVIAAAFVLLCGTRPAYVFAAVVALGGLSFVVLYRYVDVPAIGPVPSMYEPIWFFQKSLSAGAEAIAGLIALGCALRSPSRQPDSSRSGHAHGQARSRSRDLSGQ